ncbi:YchJ family protein [Actinacidiphila acidipaludis]|uniref:UPF0225 protein K7862_17570 n=1 Tax=Actinacidiphila acidipaludis TaxID=2873382 RepID=A0ABS7Q8F5_9ACTN|nr:YchJ family protein [Streptomyces acidipaludis]MBY8879430.1 YchJ family protein [Streptomyces acidipaludis]
MARRSARPSRPPRPAVPTMCPCGLGVPYADCCGAFHAGGATAPTAERLMRSRYSAFAVGDAGYLLRTWHPSTRPAHLDLDGSVRWTGLDILATTGGTAFHSEGTVEFAAHYRVGGEVGAQRECSRFLREGGGWFYLDGEGGPG